jgi:hypothetical protein
MAAHFSDMQASEWVGGWMDWENSSSAFDAPSESSA